MNAGWIQARQVDADSIRQAIDSVLSGPAYQFRAPRDDWALVRRAWLALLDWTDQLRAGNPIAYRVLVWTLIAILGAIVGHALWIAARTIRAGTAPPERQSSPTSVAPHDATWYGEEAQRLAARGRLVEAMQMDFLRLVLELDARRVMSFHPSKTPIEYAREAQCGPQARGEFRALVAALYRYAFGRLVISESAWDHWRAVAVAERYARAQ